MGERRGRGSVQVLSLFFLNYNAVMQLVRNSKQPPPHPHPVTEPTTVSDC